VIAAALPSRVSGVPRSAPSRRLRTSALAWIACVALALCGCRAAAFQGKEVSEEQSRAELAAANAQIERGQAESALRALAPLWNARNLTPAVRVEVEHALDRASQPVAAQLGASGNSPAPLSDLLDEHWPRRVRARLSIAYARLLLERNRRMDTYRALRELDELHPTHEERANAGALLAQAGLNLAADPRRYWLFFRYRNYAVPVLEYLVLHYPSDARCAQAYWELAQIYEEWRDYDTARERYEDLVLYHPNDPRGIEAELAIPALRLRQIQRVDFDRRSLELARSELEQWIERHPNDTRRAQADELRRDALARLCDSDLKIARFYLRIEKPEGAHQHALRARDFAALVGDETREQEALRLLERAPHGPAGQPPPEGTRS